MTGESGVGEVRKAGMHLSSQLSSTIVRDLSFIFVKTESQ